MSSRHEFPELLQNAIDGGLVSIFGENTAKAVKFYVDTSIALRDPNTYAKSLERMFGEGAKSIVGSICDQLCEMVDLGKREWHSLGECVRSAKDSYEQQPIE